MTRAILRALRRRPAASSDMRRAVLEASLIRAALAAGADPSLAVVIACAELSRLEA